MKWQIHTALIAGVAFAGAGVAQAQVHHNVYAPTNHVMNHNAWHGNGMTNGYVGYNNIWNGTATTPYSNYRGNGFVPTTAGQGIASPGAFQYPLNNSHHYGHQGVVRTVPSPVVTTTTTPVVTSGTVAPNLATMRQEVRADKMAVKNDLATGNNAQLRQDEMRLQADERMERQVRQQGYGTVNNGIGVANPIYGAANNNLINTRTFRPTDRVLQTNQLPERQSRQQNYAALHANYKNRANDAASIHARNPEAAARGAGHSATATP